MKLEETVNSMLSEDFKERFKAEYAQAKIRRNGLADMLVRMDTGNLSFDPKTPRSVFAHQLKVMDEYMMVLEARAAIEGILL